MQDEGEEMPIERIRKTCQEMSSENDGHPKLCKSSLLLPAGDPENLKSPPERASGPVRTMICRSQLCTFSRPCALDANKKVAIKICNIFGTANQSRNSTVNHARVMQIRRAFEEHVHSLSKQFYDDDRQDTGK